MDKLCTLVLFTIIVVFCEIGYALYTEGDRAFFLTDSTIDKNIYNQKHAVAVQFYGPTCPHCKAYAPTYKTYVAEYQAWDEVVKLAVVNCDENKNTCRRFGIRGYTKFRYFGPETAGGKGSEISADAPHDSLIANMAKEKRPPSFWPQLRSITVTKSNALFNDESQNVAYMVLINQSRNRITTVAQDVSIDFRRTPTVSVRQVVKRNVATNL